MSLYLQEHWEDVPRFRLPEEVPVLFEQCYHLRVQEVLQELIVSKITGKDVINMVDVNYAVEVKARLLRAIMDINKRFSKFYQI